MNNNLFKAEIKKMADNFLSDLYEQHPSYKYQDLIFISNLLREIQIEYLVRSKKLDSKKSINEFIKVINEETKKFKQDLTYILEGYYDGA